MSSDSGLESLVGRSDSSKTCNKKFLSAAERPRSSKSGVSWEVWSVIAHGSIGGIGGGGDGAEREREREDTSNGKTRG